MRPCHGRWGEQEGRERVCDQANADEDTDRKQTLYNLVQAP